MTTTVITSVVMQGGQKGEGSKKQQPRLPVIAPKDDVSSSAGSSRSRSAQGVNTSASVPSRSRLPPRSRTGCWTCRTRKVKCDEGRPVCGQCARLGHACDYSPRLAFRDDTRRVVDRMQDVSIIASPVWDPSSPRSTEGTASSRELEDTLPPFATLTSDEDRERKAEAQTPGTFHVVVNQDSFNSHPDYSDQIMESPAIMARRGSIAHSLTSSGVGRDMSVGEIMVTEDPNTVIVKRFEDFNKRSMNSKDIGLSESPIMLKLQTSMASEYEDVPLELIPAYQPDAKGETVVQNKALMEQFRRRVWPQLAQLECTASQNGRPQYPGVDMIEEIAAIFAPCSHALMAVAATTLAHQKGEQRVDALQHHHEVLTALKDNLKSAEDMTSDGTFLTHFLLLVYEIVAAESGTSNLWSHHLAQLLRITMMRRNALGGERYPFLVWWICNLDLQALFSGAGTGDFIGTMLKDDMMPPPAFHLCPLGMDGASIVYPEEAETLPTLLQLNYELTILAYKIGLLARELRSEAVDFSAFVPDLASPLPASAIDIRLRQHRLYELQASLRQLWQDPSIRHLRDSIDMLPPRARRVLENAMALYRTCLLYSFTSMWPTQQVDTGADAEDEIAISVREILRTAEGILNSPQPRFECRFIAFPLFMAGVVSQVGAEKMMALRLLGKMEEHSIGPNTRSTKEVLQTIYERQTQRFMLTGQNAGVNWMDIMVEKGVSVVSFGM